MWLHIIITEWQSADISALESQKLHNVRTFFEKSLETKTCCNKCVSHTLKSFVKSCLFLSHLNGYKYVSTLAGLSPTVDYHKLSSLSVACNWNSPEASSTCSSILSKTVMKTECNQNVSCWIKSKWSIFHQSVM